RSAGFGASPSCWPTDPSAAERPSRSAGRTTSGSRTGSTPHARSSAYRRYSRPQRDCWRATSFPDVAAPTLILLRHLAAVEGHHLGFLTRRTRLHRARALAPRGPPRLEATPGRERTLRAPVSGRHEAAVLLRIG